MRDLGLRKEGATVREGEQEKATGLRPGLRAAEELRVLRKEPAQKKKPVLETTIKKTIPSYKSGKKKSSSCWKEERRTWLCEEKRGTICSQDHC